MRHRGREQGRARRLTMRVLSHLEPVQWMAERWRIEWQTQHSGSSSWPLSCRKAHSHDVSKGKAKERRAALVRRELDRRFWPHHAGRLSHADHVLHALAPDRGPELLLVCRDPLHLDRNPRGRLGGKVRLGSDLEEGARCRQGPFAPPPRMTGRNKR